MTICDLYKASGMPSSSSSGSNSDSQIKKIVLHAPDPDEHFVGAIIVITSIAENKGIPGFTAYSATKAAVRSFVRTWTAELKDRRVRVKAISPGPIDTPIFEQQAPTKEGADQARAEFAAAVPFGRLGRPEEIASTALFLSSDEASFIAGVNLPVDGGMTAI